MRCAVASMTPAVGQDLRRAVAGYPHWRQLVVSDELARLDVPVGAEHQLQLQDRGAFDARTVHCS